jgi:hypothetical protein
MLTKTINPALIGIVGIALAVAPTSVGMSVG